MTGSLPADINRLPGRLRVSGGWRPGSSSPTVILCAYATLNPQTRAALPPSAELADVSGDFRGYWRELTRRWNRPGHLIIIEQDIVIHDDVMPQFAQCPRPWCVFPYETVTGMQDRGLGCTRLSPAARIAAKPELIQTVPGSCWECQGRPDGCWRHLDGQIAFTLEVLGFTRHVHSPAVEHCGIQQRMR